MGAFFSLMSATFAYEDPLSKASEKLVGTRAQTAFIFKEMGRNMWTSGKGFAKVGALYSGFECCIEGVSETASSSWLNAESYSLDSTVPRTTSTTLLLVDSCPVLYWPVRRAFAQRWEVAPLSPHFPL